MIDMKKRILIKLSGESLSSGKGCFDEARCRQVAHVLAEVARMGVEPGVVIGGGNIWRGRFSNDMDPVNADQMGMLATVINALCAQDFLLREGVKAEVFTAQEMNRFARLYTASAADECLKNGGIALLAGGSGNPFFTTDTAVALRAAELKADTVFKGTTVEGVFDSDPRKNPEAKLLKDVTYAECIRQNLKVMDQTAFQLLMDRGVKELRVFHMDDPENILRVVRGEDLGTTVHA